MSQEFQAGDFLIFQLEAGFGLLRILAIEKTENDTTWHVSAYNEFFLDVDMADAALETPGTLTISHPHIALTNRAFESTQVARMKNEELTNRELEALNKWRSQPSPEVSDRSVRLMLGLR